MTKIKDKLTKTEFDALGESLKEFYTPDGDNYKLLLESEHNPEGILAKNQELLAELKDLKQFKGMNIEEIKEALETQKKLREKELIKKGDYETAKAEFEKTYADKIAELESKYKTLLENNAEKELELNLRNSGVREEYAADLALILKSTQIEAVENNGKIEWKNKNGIGDAADLSKVLADLKQTKPVFFKPDGASGSGASGSENSGQTGAKVLSLDAFDQLTPQQKTEFSKSGGSIE